MSLSNATWHRYKKGGAGKSTKKLLKHLREIAEVASDSGLL
jgi:hypothetical protein